MARPAREQWAIVLEALPDSIPAAARIRTLLKIAGRRLRLRCTRVSDEDEIARLQKIIDGLTHRIAAGALASLLPGRNEGRLP